MDIHNGLACLDENEKRITGYHSPIPVRQIDPQHISQCIEHMAVDFFDPDKSPIGNSIERYHALDNDRTVAQQMIAHLGVYLLLESE